MELNRKWLLGLFLLLFSLITASADDYRNTYETRKVSGPGNVYESSSIYEPSSLCETRSIKYPPPVFGYGYYHKFGYHGTCGPHDHYTYTPNYYVVPSEDSKPGDSNYYPPVIYAQPYTYVYEAPAVRERQERYLPPTIIYNNGPISAYNQYPRTIITNAMDR